MSRGDLTDSEWHILNPLLPDRGDRGPPISDKRRMVNGILWVLRTGAPWRDMPERYGNWNSVLTEGRLVPPEAQAPQPDYDIHSPRPQLVAAHMMVCLSDTVQDAEAIRGAALAR